MPGQPNGWDELLLPDEAGDPDREERLLALKRLQEQADEIESRIIQRETGEPQ